MHSPSAVSCSTVPWRSPCPKATPSADSRCGRCSATAPSRLALLGEAEKERSPSADRTSKLFGAALGFAFALGLEDTLDVTINWNSHFSTQAMTKSVYDRDTLSWVGPLADGRPSDSLAVAVTGNLLEWSMTVDDSLAALTLIQAPGSLKTFAAAIPMGWGNTV